MNDSLPALSSEVVHRVVELLKFFNTRSCQLVLGAGAMQVKFNINSVSCYSLIIEIPQILKCMLVNLYLMSAVLIQLYTQGPVHMMTFPCVVLITSSIFFWDLNK